MVSKKKQFLLFTFSHMHIMRKKIYLFAKSACSLHVQGTVASVFWATGNKENIPLKPQATPRTNLYLLTLAMLM